MKTFARIVLLIIGFQIPAAAQGSEQTTPTAVQWTLGAATATQKEVITSVFLLYCPKSGMKGTGFLLASGLIVSNNHVVEGCTAADMQANPWGGQQFGFDKMATDATVDLALLHPTKHQTGGLELGTDEDPELGTEVNTWGFPLTYNGPAPLLSIGYVAGFVKDGADGHEVKHVVVNGAFNPGNSGGPLLRWKDNKVIGVVVAKFHLYLPYVKDIITVPNKQTSGFMYQGTDAQGKTVSFSEAQVVGAVLEQFYNNTQVMIGEAISVSELRSFVKQRQSEVQ
jgi:hypothetical protein